jgi:hypothetical protein
MPMSFGKAKTYTTNLYRNDRTHQIHSKERAATDETTGYATHRPYPCPKQITLLKGTILQIKIVFITGTT